MNSIKSNIENHIDKKIYLIFLPIFKSMRYYYYKKLRFITYNLKNTSVKNYYIYE